ncbi:MAG: M1 family metallopeptidase [Chlorobi bacterium]|nr:M1 family metallopeptidase [Chlorobiota bacterium]
MIVVFFFSGIYFLYGDKLGIVGNNLRLVVDFSTADLFEENKREIDIINYDIDIELFPNNEEIIATTKVKGVIKSKNKKQIELDFYDNFNIQSVQLNGNAADYYFKEDQLVIENKEIKSDTFEVSVSYDGTPRNLGFGSFAFTEWNDNIMVSTLNEPVFASTWFPCNDTPLDKALLNISVTADSEMVSVSNGKLISVEKEGEKTKYNWVTVYPIATYLIAIYSAPYQSFNQQYISSLSDTMNIDYYVLPDKLEDAEFAFDDHPSYLKVLSDLYGEYPFIKEKYGAAQITWSQGAMESQTITGIGTNFISKAKFFSSMMLHEVAHSWWGNSVTPKSWKDIWLNEGFATYSEALYWEKTKGKSALISTMESFRVENDLETLYAPKMNIFSKTIYNKGAWVLHMLRREFGDTLFLKTLRNYYQEFKYGNADTYDFKKVCEETSGKDLKKFFDQWVFAGKGKIEIDYKWDIKNSENNKKELSISLAQTQDGYKYYNFPIDILIKENNGNEFISTHYITSKDTVISFNIPDDFSSFEFDPENWLLASFKSLEK